MEIRKLKISDAAVFMAYAADWARDTSLFTIDSKGAYQQLTADNFADWLTKIESEEITTDKVDWSTATRYFAVADEGAVAGEVVCRWQLDKGHLLEWAGHVGYGVAPSYRGRHLASNLLSFALEQYRCRGILRVLVSAHEDNVASRKTIEACGGVLENVVAADGGRVCRYWISCLDK